MSGFTNQLGVARGIGLIVVSAAGLGGCPHEPNYVWLGSPSAVPKTFPARFAASWEWSRSVGDCLLAGEPVAPTPERVVAAFGQRFPLCTHARGRRIIPVVTEPGVGPATRRDGIRDGGDEDFNRQPWYTAREEMYGVAPYRECVLMLDLRSQDGVFLLSHGGSYFEGCIARHAANGTEYYVVRVRVHIEP